MGVSSLLKITLAEVHHRIIGVILLSLLFSSSIFIGFFFLPLPVAIVYFVFTFGPVLLACHRCTIQMLLEQKTPLIKTFFWRAKEKLLEWLTV